jgi:hypothetical protein
MANIIPKAKNELLQLRIEKRILNLIDIHARHHISFRFSE